MCFSAALQQPMTIPLSILQKTKIMSSLYSYTYIGFLYASDFPISFDETLKELHEASDEVVQEHSTSNIWSIWTL